MTNEELLREVQQIASAQVTPRRAKRGIFGNGNGQATREIELGYRPYFVFVYAQNYPFTQTITSSGTTWIYAASAVDSNINGSKGIAITDNGFEVSQTSSTSPMDGIKMHLNAGSNYYGYLAVRK